MDVKENLVLYYTKLSVYYVRYNVAYRPFLRV